MPIELDYMEYANDALAQAAYPTDSDIIKQEVTNTSWPFQWAPLAQGFKVPADYVINKISVKLMKGGAIDLDKYMWAYIYNDNAGVPGSAISVQSNQIQLNTITTDPTATWYDFTFGTPVSLTAGTQYWIFLNINGYGPAQVYWCHRNTDIYPDGKFAYTDTGSWVLPGLPGGYDSTFRVYAYALQCYSESGIKVQGSYSLKGVAGATASLNLTLERTIGSPIDLSDINTIKFDIYGLRTGAHIKVGIRDSGLVWTEKTHTVVDSNTWETVTWDISGVANADKDAIDRIKITILNADVANVFYLDKMYAEVIEGWNPTVIMIG